MSEVITITLLAVAVGVRTWSVFACTAWLEELPADVQSTMRKALSRNCY